MVKAMIKCPVTGAAVFSGIAFGTLAQFDAAKVENNTVGCPSCKGTHLVDNETVKAFPSESLIA